MNKEKEIRDSIKKSQKELEHLKEEEEILYQEKKNMPLSSFYRELGIIERHRKDEEQKIKESEELLCKLKNQNNDYTLNNNYSIDKFRYLLERIDELKRLINDSNEESYHEEQQNKQLPAVVDSNSLMLPALKEEEVKQLPSVRNFELPKVVDTKPKIEQKRNRGLISIIEEITKDVPLKVSDGKRYKASHIKVAKRFKDELSSGNYLYNIVHFVPNVIKVPFKLLTKITNKILYSKKAKKRIETIKERVNNLSDEDLIIIYKEYRSGRIIQERFPTGLNIILEEKMRNFVLNKVARLNSEIEKKYIDIFGTIGELNSINDILKKSISTEEREKLINYKNQLIKGKALEIKDIRDKYKEANSYLSGGIHGFSEDMRAAATKMSYVGKRFSKEHDLDLVLLQKEASLERDEIEAINEGNDEKAIYSFVEMESLLSSNTEIKNSIFGKKTVGKKYYNPLAEELNYSPDPFIRDIFTSIAITSAIVSAINVISNDVKIREIVDENNKQVNDINYYNKEKIAEINEYGHEIVSKRGTMINGMKAQNRTSILASANELERRALDKSAEKYGGWAIETDIYHKYDHKAHEIYNNFYNDTRNSLRDITAKYSSGNISDAEAISLISGVSNDTQKKFISITEDCLETLTKYAKEHPKFDLSAVKKSMQYLVNHPNAIGKMNKAMVRVEDIGSQISDVDVQQLIPLHDIPNSMKTTLFAAASSTLLAGNVMSTLQRKYGYGNKVTKLVDEYNYNLAKEENYKIK